jgi:hypothetical protein
MIQQVGTYQELKEKGLLDYYFVVKEEEQSIEEAKSYVKTRQSIKQKQGEMSDMIDRISWKKNSDR